MTIRASSTKTVKLGKHDHPEVACPLRSDYDVDERYWKRITEKAHATPELLLSSLKLWVGPHPNPVRAGRVVAYMRERGVRVSLEEIERTA